MTPEALYWIGICLREQQENEKAAAYFQRVYVLYGQHTEWVAKAYEQSVECLQVLGKQEDVIRTWREMAAHS